MREPGDRGGLAGPPGLTAGTQTMPHGREEWAQSPRPKAESTGVLRGQIGARQEGAGAVAMRGLARPRSRARFPTSLTGSIVGHVWRARRRGPRGGRAGRGGPEIADVGAAGSEPGGEVRVWGWGRAGLEAGVGQASGWHCVDTSVSARQSQPANSNSPFTLCTGASALTLEGRWSVRDRPAPTPLCFHLARVSQSASP